MDPVITAEQIELQAEEMFRHGTITTTNADDQSTEMIELNQMGLNDEVDEELIEQTIQGSAGQSDQLDDEKSKDAKNPDSTRPEKKKKKSSSSVGKRYPTQYMKIGEIKCIFLSCWYRGRSPFITLGPSWPFTSVLILLACLISGYFYMMIQISGQKADPWHMLWCQTCIGANIGLLIGGILKNPGIPQRHIDRLLKEQQGKGEDDEEVSETELQDIESGGAKTSGSLEAR